jgi:hypothetical protein
MDAIVVNRSRNYATVVGERSCETSRQKEWFSHMRNANVLSLPGRIDGQVAESKDRFAPLVARVRHWSLDTELATGVAPWHSHAHAARALQLTGERGRSTLASSLERTVHDAVEPRRAMFSSVVRPPRARVLEARDLLVAIASWLRSSEPVDPRGVAALRVLLTDGSSSLYTSRDPQTLIRELQRIQLWLGTER